MAKQGLRGRVEAMADGLRRLRMLGGSAESLWLARKQVPEVDARDRARGIRRLSLALSDVRARITGDGPRTFVIIPDPPNTIEHYDALIELLRPHAQVVVFEVPGFGLSFPRTGRFDFSPRAYTALTIEVIEHLGLRDVTLVYACIGGYVGLMASRQRPDLVSRLVLCQTPSQDDMRRWAKRFDKLGLLGMPVVGQGLMMIAKDRATRFWYQAALPEGADDAPFLSPALAAQSQGGPYALASGIQAMRTLAPDSLDGVAQPTTIVWGHADRTHAKTEPRSLLPVVPHARFVSFDRSGHFPDLEEPERFAALLLDPQA